ncbi:MAG: alpha/beta fold hydrolase [bacterium]|nr:alpha/beta fold hydrolase [bacterium]
MRKIYVYVLFFLFFIFIPIKVLSDELVKDVNNPIEIISEVENWDEISQRQPAILFESDIFKIWYASYNGTHFRIVYGESPDLKTIRTKKIININYDQSFDFHDPSIIKVNDKYELYFAVSKNETNYKILKAVSNDGINFEDSPVVILNPDLPWNNKAVSAPSIFYENNKYYLFYTGWNGSEWKLGLSISNDGTDWVNCTNNPIIPYASGPTIIKQRDKYVLFFHSSNASNIESVETNDLLSCLSNWSNRKIVLTRNNEYDTKLITDPNTININDKIYLIYSSLSLANKWTLNLAKNFEQELIKYIVFIPGFMTSWNKNALIYNLDTSIYDWKILDFFKEYDGLLNTLKNKDYILDDNLFVFAYDWRKPLEDLSENLNTFVQDKIFSKDYQAEIYIVGHSFGGLVGRIYTQKHPDNIKKIITVGSPHQGTAKVYQPIQAGKIDLSTDLLSLAQNIVINLNRSFDQSNKDVIKFLIPSLYDLYPNYDFLKNEDGEIISKESLLIKNELLPNYEDISAISDKLFSIYSDYDQALFGFQVEPQSAIHKLFEHYEDGYPTKSIFDSGDKNLPKISTSFGNNLIQMTGDHEEIIYKKDSIKKILDLLDITYIDDDIVEGAKTVINPSLIFIIKSPAVMEVNLADKSFYEEDGLIFISNASSGNYKLKVQGTGAGKYTILVGQISQSNELWEELNGEITTVIPTDQIDIFDIDYNNQQAESIINDSKTPTPSPTNAVSNTTSSNTSSNDKNNSSDDETLVAQQNTTDLQTEEVLGTSTEAKNKEKTKKTLNDSKSNKNSENKNLSSFLADIVSIVLGGVSYFFRDKIFGKSNIKLLIKKLVNLIIK